MWQHMQGVVGYLITTLLQIYKGILKRKNVENQLRFDRIIAMSLSPHFFGPRYTSTILTRLQKFWVEVLTQIEHCNDSISCLISASSSRGRGDWVFLFKSQFLKTNKQPLVITTDKFSEIYNYNNHNYFMAMSQAITQQTPVKNWMHFLEQSFTERWWGYADKKAG